MEGLHLARAFLLCHCMDHRPRECKRSPSVIIRTSVNEGRVLLT